MDTNVCKDPTNSQSQELEALLQLKSQIERKYRGIRKPGRKWAPTHIMSLYRDLEKQLENNYKFNNPNNK